MSLWKRSTVGWAAVEIKASSTVGQKDLRQLRWFADRLGDRFVGGALLHTGPTAAPFGAKLVALPIAAIWAGRSRRAWGWHRLVDEWAGRIDADADLRSGELVMDIDAGQGALTRHLVDAGVRVLAVERYPGPAGDQLVGQLLTKRHGCGHAERTSSMSVRACRCSGAAMSRCSPSSTRHSSFRIAAS